MKPQRVLAIDPGTVKCGIAVIDAGDETPLYLAIVAAHLFESRLREVIAMFAPELILLGSGTANATAAAMLESIGSTVVLVDEYGSTLAARARYFRAFPPTGWRRLIPAGMRLPPGPIDDWAAVVIAEQYLTSQKK